MRWLLPLLLALPALGFHQTAAEAAAAGLKVDDDAASRLAVMFLHTRPGEGNELREGIASVRAALARTSLSVYVFTRRGSSQHGELGEGVIEVQLPAAAWTVPPWANQGGRGFSEADVDYRLMGLWRLGFQFHFARALGHTMLLQVDEDVRVGREYEWNMVAEMQRNRYGAASYCVDCYVEAEDINRGLAELARFYMVTRRLGQPVGPLWAHCAPPNISGLTTEQWHWPDYRGWDRVNLAGHFNFFALDWWFSPPVADFVDLCVRSGSPFEERWNELGVQTMLRLLLLEEERFWVIPNHAVKHKGWAHTPQKQGG